MKRTLLEVVLVLALAAAGFFSWTNLQKGKAASSQVAAVQIKADVAEEMLKDSEKEVEAAEDALDTLKEELEPLQAKALELDAVKVKLRRFDLVAKHVYDGFISRSCLGDVARAVAAALPGVSVEVLGASESLHISWE